MAPPKRARKPGARRIDAALDALGVRGMGFEDKVIKKTVDNLLKVYGGNVGWRAIEEDSYRLVIETIIDEQADAEKQLLIEGCSQKGEVEENTSLSVVIKLEDAPEEEKCLAIAPSAPPLAILPCSSKNGCSEGNQRSPEFHSAVVLHSPHRISQPKLEPDACSSKHQTLGRTQREMRAPPCFGWIDDDDEGD